MNLNARTPSKFYTPPWYRGGGGGGWMEPLPGVFDMLQHIETILAGLPRARSERGAEPHTHRIRSTSFLLVVT